MVINRCQSNTYFLKKLKIKLINVNRTRDTWISDGVNDYKGRLERYVVFEDVVVKPGKHSSQERRRVLQEEAAKILTLIKKDDHLVLLDDTGQSMDSIQFSSWINKKNISLQGDLVFVIGGAYGFDEQIVKAADEKVSLSRMTFTHQMVRLIFMEQLYRAFTILRNEPYHHG